jgi:hypothetical protein
MSRTPTSRYGNLPEGNEFNFHGDALDYLHVKQSLKGSQFAAIGHGEPQQKLTQGVWTAHVFDSSLRPKSGNPRNNQDGTRKIQAKHKTNHRIVFRKRGRSRACQVELRFAGLRVNVGNRQVALPWPGIQPDSLRISFRYISVCNSQAANGSEGSSNNSDLPQASLRGPTFPRADQPPFLASGKTGWLVRAATRITIVENVTSGWRICE